MLVFAHCVNVAVVSVHIVCKAARERSNAPRSDFTVTLNRMSAWLSSALASLFFFGTQD